VVNRYKNVLRVTEHVWPEGTSPLVSIACLTYNHEKFIRQALEGFLAQETTFPVEILIHDDASTDGTPEIIREYERLYPRLIKPIYQQENQRSQGRQPGRINRQRASGEYIATCEGDDYWVAADKLQRQVEILESDPNCVICAGRAKTWRETEGRFAGVTPREGEHVASLNGRDFYHLRDWIKTCTRMTRARDLSALPAGYAGDFRQVHYLLAQNPGKVIRCLPDIVAVYREHSGGVYSGASSLPKLKTDVEDGRVIAGLYRDHRKSGMLFGSLKSCCAIVFHRTANWRDRVTYLGLGAVISLQMTVALLEHGWPHRGRRSPLVPHPSSP
jgi:glycosyltransferase involved in cell wall biosynthesis